MKLSSAGASRDIQRQKYALKSLSTIFFICHETPKLMPSLCAPRDGPVFLLVKSCSCGAPGPGLIGEWLPNVSSASKTVHGGGRPGIKMQGQHGLGSLTSNAELRQREQKRL